MVRSSVWIAALIVIVAACCFTLKARAADPLQPGAAAPDFSLPSQEDASVSLTQYKGKWVVLYFYPKDMTTGCTIEAHNFQRDLPKYDALNAVVLGVSLDTVESHKTFCTKDSLTFKLLADPDHKVRRGAHQVRPTRHIPHLARRQDRQVLVRRQPQHP
jgi:peroxiredoxin Q/BCP